MAQTSQKPNVVFILLDDLDRYTMENFMPRTERLVKDRGISFENATFSTPLCCPSRAAIQTGLYPHNSDVLKNNPPRGGFETFKTNRLLHKTYGRWVDEAGYRTGYFGKYMNGYEKFLSLVPKGWDTWYAGAPLSRYYGLNGEVYESVEYQKKVFDAVVMKERGIPWISRAAQRNAPFFAVLNPYAPHWPAEHPDRFDTMFRKAQLPDDPSFDEADVSDKPGWVRRQSRIGPKEKSALTDFHRDRLRSVEHVDRRVKELFETLGSAGELNNTYVVVWADNGFHLGQHRLESQVRGGKLSPYTHDVELPLWVRGPGIRAGTTSGALVSNIDLAPTFAEMTGATVPEWVDGRSFLPLAKEQDVSWRRFAYIRGNPASDGDKAVYMPSWKQIRTQKYAYHYYPSTGEEELYDLEDPYQLDNILKTSTVDTEGYRDLIRRMKDCRGQECRNIEEDAAAIGQAEKAAAR